jgi:hypothetical protein
VPADSPNPTVIRSIAVTTADVVAARELNLTSDDHAVLRVTPPFAARMRARLHVDRRDDRTDRSDDGGVVGGSDDGRVVESGPQPVPVDPAQLLADPPSYPRPADTEDRLRADPERTYTVERHHECHAAAVEQWREALPESIRERVTLDTPDGSHEVTVRTLQSDLL